MAINHTRVWLITGASSGFGRAIAEAALAAGDIVVAAARRTDALADLVASAPERVTVLALDVTDANRISAAVAEVLDRHGRVDVLVNNAGRGAIGAAEETSDRELRDLMDLHFFGPAALTRAVLPGMRERGTGAIVQMSSMGGRFTFAGVGAYSATKFALEGWSEALAKEVERFGIKVLIVEPGAFRTSFNGPGALLMSKPISAYDEQIEPLRNGMPDDDGKQPGDPAKAAGAIMLALDSQDPPLRLALGNDAVDAIGESLDTAKAELAAWERVGRSAVFD
jgi:NAD(P)-dependent dehydrogenase (short-subunit alcohol dehydrogenase family)